jgi:hypothetical protein
MDNAVQVERRRCDRRLAQHHVRLSAMVCLVIEEVAERYWRGLHVTPALIVDAGERLSGNVGTQVCEERFDSRVFRDPRVPQF